MKYCVLNKRAKFRVTIFMHYIDITILVLGHFILTHPVYVYSYCLSLSVCLSVCNCLCLSVCAQRRFRLQYLPLVQTGMVSTSAVVATTSKYLATTRDSGSSRSLRGMWLTDSVSCEMFCRTTDIHLPSFELQDRVFQKKFWKSCKKMFPQHISCWSFLRSKVKAVIWFHG